MPIFTVFRHYADVYDRSRTENLAGQEKAAWTLNTLAVRCHYVARTAVSRVTPTYAETENIVMFFPADSPVTYGSRLFNVSDKFGNLIEAGPMEVVGILKQAGFSGKIHHLVIDAKRVIE